MNDYELAAKLTSKQVQNVLASWDDESQDMKSFRALVRLGDSEELAMASILNRKQSEDCTGFYTCAYTS